MRLLHTAATTHARFDDPNLVSYAGLVPAVRLAQNIGLEDLVAEHVRVSRQGRREPRAEDRRAGGRDGRRRGHHRRDGPAAPRRDPATFGGIRAPSTLGSFLRGFDHGNVRQLAAVHRRVLAELAARTPLLPGADTVAFSMSTRCSGGCTGTPNRVPRSGTPRSPRNRCWCAG